VSTTGSTGATAHTTATAVSGGSGSCTDHIRDGEETDIDCGGPTCPPCGLEQICLSDQDCGSGACDATTSTCVASSCIDHRMDGGETDIDCGGPNDCLRCEKGQGCLVASDCDAMFCDGLSHNCVPNRCGDHLQDGVETDIDCGGANACSRCLPGKKCFVNSDCSVGHSCSGGMCI
jgi:hypothetical protein